MDPTHFLLQKKIQSFLPERILFVFFGFFKGRVQLGTRKMVSWGTGTLGNHREDWGFSQEPQESHIYSKEAFAPQKISPRRFLCLVRYAAIHRKRSLMERHFDTLPKQNYKKYPTTTSDINIHHNRSYTQTLNVWGYRPTFTP